MKKMIRLVKGVLGGLLICACVSACSDDTVDNLSDENVKVENTSPAYLTISFKTNASTDSRVASRTDTEANDGDGHGTAEDSGHKDAGTAAENKVNSALVIAHPTNTNVAFAKLYSVTGGIQLNDKTNSNYFYISKDAISVSDDNELNAIELAIGEYNIMVVVNPPLELYEETFKGEKEGLSTSVLAKVKALYEKVLDGNYQVVKDEITVNDYLAGPQEKGFMMANQAEKTVTLTANDTPDSPQRVTVVVERAASKITYRQLEKDNTYPVVIETQLTAETMNGAIYNTETKTWDPKTLLLATDLEIAESETEGPHYYNDIVVLYEAVGDATTPTMTVYRKTDIPVYNDKDEVIAYQCEGPLTPVTVDTWKDEDDDAIKKGFYVVADVNNPTASINFSYDAAKAERSTYNVTIEGYALTNLSQKVNYVRHTVEYSGLYGIPFGTVEDKYLWTPYWETKNAVDYTTGFETNAETWYHNPLHKVAEESHNLQLLANGADEYTLSDKNKATYYKKLSVDNGKLGSEHNDNNTIAVGQTLGYCLENSTDITHQTHGLSTGISFVARITKPDGERAELYRYNGYVYESLEAIQNAYSAKVMASFDPADKSYTFQKLVDDPDSATKEQLGHYGIVKYEEGLCYYYTTEIKHYDNADNSKMGYMEYAIMRNNIYSMAIKGIRYIGDPYLDPTPSTPNESGKAALDIEVQIVPWTVRYNDIEF